jgi:hypothetical protein
MLGSNIVPRVMAWEHFVTYSFLGWHEVVFLLNYFREQDFLKGYFRNVPGAKGIAELFRHIDNYETPTMAKRVRALLQLVAQGDSVNFRGRRYGEGDRMERYVLQFITPTYEKIAIIVALGASADHCRSVRRTYSTADYGFVAYAYLTYNRAARLIQRRVRARRAAALRIQRVWRRCITDPSHPACRRRLMHEFKGLTDVRSIKRQKLT